MSLTLLLALGQRLDEMKLQIGFLENFLHIAHNAEDDLRVIESKKTDGSCVWVTDLHSFKEWRDLDEELLLCHWLTGQAGVGKSVLTAHVIQHLQHLGVDTCFHFFQHGHRAQQTVSSLLCDLAFQMALIHPSVRETLLAMHNAGLRFDKDDERAIWRKLFINGILQISIPTTQYWVIDGLDECVDPEGLFFLLQRFDSRFCVRIFFSSRRLPELEKCVAGLQPRAYHHHISTEETQADIKRFVESNSEDLPVELRDKPALAKKLVQMSDGVFLWAELAFEGLRRAFSEEQIDEALREVPAGMTPIYDRILDSMAKNQRQIKLMRAIIEWSVFGTRTLHTTELQDILVHDLNSKIPNMERTVDELCGQLLQITNGRVQIIHATARDHLLNQGSNSIFGVDLEATNQHLATVCLRYLTGDEMRPPRRPALVSKSVSRSPFVDYACTSFAEHLAASRSTSDELFMLVDKFLRTNVLSWIEYILREKQNLYYLTRASKLLRRYLKNSKIHVSPLGGQFGNIDGWQTDLVRITLKFGDNLLRDPSSVYFILPALCPTDSRIREQFGRTTSGLRLSGLTNTSWDDCICYIDHRQSRALALASCDGLFALGFMSGAIKLYHQSTYREIASLHHGEPVKILRFSNAYHLLASGGHRQLKMWSVSGELLWSIPHESALLSMAFINGDECLLAVNKHNHIITLNVSDGTRNWGDGDEEEAKSGLKPKSRPCQIALRADICPLAELVAIAHVGLPPQIWSIEDDFMITTCHLARDNPDMPITPVSQMLFNPNPSIELLAVAYQDGELAIFQTWAGEVEVHSLSADSLTLASTPDGRTLASGDARGTIKIWDFDTLALRYCIKSTEYEVRALAFSGDGLRLYDIRDTKTKIWEPAVLVRRAIHEDMESSVTGTESIAFPATVLSRDQEAVSIMQIHAPPDAGCIFAGRDDGSVVTYHCETGEMVSTLYSHRRYVFVTSITWNHSMIATSDASNTLQVHTLSKAAHKLWSSSGKQFEKKLNGRPRELLLHPREPWLLVSLVHTSTVIATSTGTEYPLPITTVAEDDYRGWLWICLESGSNLLLGARSHIIDIYAVDKLGPADEWQKRVWCPTNGGKPLDQRIARLHMDKQEKYIAVLVEVATHDPQAPKLLVYETAQLRENGAETVAYDPILTIPGQAMKTFLGFYGARVVYLDHGLWVTAIDPTKVGFSAGSNAVQTERYLFIPQEYIGSNNGVNGVVTSIGSVAFPKHGELAVVRNVFGWPYTGKPSDVCGISRRAGKTGVFMERVKGRTKTS
jgi:WD40 repeat protein